MSWRWAAASRRGTSHLKNGTRCQDARAAFLAGPKRDVMVLIASDGAGSTTFGGEGAWVLCRTLSTAAREHFGRATALPSDETVNSWIDDARDRLAVAATNKSSERREFASTLVAAIVSPNGVLVVHVGDGAAVLAGAEGWDVVSWPAAGEYASTTYFVTDEPSPQVRITRLDAHPTAVALFTDGIERLVLDFTNRTAPAGFFDQMMSPVRRSSATGRDAVLSRALADYLGSETVNARTDDDKTLILAARA